MVCYIWSSEKRWSGELKRVSGRWQQRSALRKTRVLCHLSSPVTQIAPATPLESAATEKGGGVYPLALFSIHCSLIAPDFPRKTASLDSSGKSAQEHPKLRAHAQETAALPHPSLFRSAYPPAAAYSRSAHCRLPFRAQSAVCREASRHSQSAKIADNSLRFAVAIPDTARYKSCRSNASR